MKLYTQQRLESPQGQHVVSATPSRPGWRCVRAGDPRLTLPLLHTQHQAPGTPWGLPRVLLRGEGDGHEATAVEVFMGHQAE